MGKNTLERDSIDNNNNNLDNQGGLDISKFKDKELILFDLGGTIACIPTWVAWSFVPRDVVEHLRTHSIDYTKPAEKNQTESERLEIDVDWDWKRLKIDVDWDWIGWTVPKWLIDQTQKEIGQALLYPDFHSLITIKRCRDGKVKLVTDEEDEKVEEGEKIEQYGNIIEFLKHEWYGVGLASVLAKPYEKVVRTKIKKWTFDYKFYSYDIWKLKNNPEFFEYIKEKTGIGFDKMVMIWDSIKSDIAWANQVWIDTICIDRKHKGPAENVYLKRFWINTIRIWTLAQLVEILFRQ